MGITVTQPCQKPCLIQGTVTKVHQQGTADKGLRSVQAGSPEELRSSQARCSLIC